MQRRHSGRLHIVLDNYGTHKHPVVRDWQDRNPRIHLHFTPTSGSRLNPRGDLLRHHHPAGHPPRHLRLGRRPRRRDPRLIDAWNDHCEPFTWTKTADEILAKAQRETNSETRH
jgi:hypothetical protein